MLPSYLGKDSEMYGEYQTELQPDLATEPYNDYRSLDRAEHRNESYRTEYPSDLSSNYDFRDRVFINDGENRMRGTAHPESEDKWEAVPQHLLRTDNEQCVQYTADPLDFLTPAEAADLPDLDFPVPDQNVIPEMVFENDEPVSSASQTPSSLMSQPPHVLSQHSTSATPSQATQAQALATSRVQTPTSSAQLIPIQSSVVAHARSGKMSVAAAQERRLKNTEAARRSRARRADKVLELRQLNDGLRSQNETLVSENRKLVAENRRLSTLVHSLEAKLETEFETKLKIKDEAN